MSVYTNEKKTALQAVRKAAILCRRVQNTIDVESIQKDDRSPVTTADFASQAIINTEIRAAFPDDPIVGEEASDALKADPALFDKVSSLLEGLLDGDKKDPDILAAIDAAQPAQVDFTKRYWTVDPIDGTKGFLRGDQFAVALALIENGQVALGVLGCPNFKMNEKDENPGYLLCGIKGEGAFAFPLLADGSLGESIAISVDAITDPKGARFCESVEKAHAAHDVHERISKALGITAFPCRMDSQAKYASVASGDASIYLRLPRTAEYREKIWDHAAGSIVVQAAGGVVTDFSGASLDFSLGPKLTKNRGIVASNGKLHPKILQAIKDHGNG